MTNIRFVGYTALAVGLINWRYLGFSAGSFAIAVGAIVLLATLNPSIHKKIQKGPTFFVALILASVAVIYSFLA